MAQGFIKVRVSDGEVQEVDFSRMRLEKNEYEVDRVAALECLKKAVVFLEGQITPHTELRAKFDAFVASDGIPAEVVAKINKEFWDVQQGK